MMDLGWTLARWLAKVTKAVADLSRASVSQKRLMAEVRKRDSEKLDAAVAAGEIDVMQQRVRDGLWGLSNGGCPKSMFDSSIVLSCPIKKYG